MIIMATGKCRAKVDDERIAISFPSGDDTVKIVMSIHAAAMLSQSARRAVADFLLKASRRPAANVIAFPTKKRAKAGRK